MSYTFAYYVAMFIGTMRILAMFAATASLIAAAYLWLTGYGMAQEKTGKEQVRDLVDWHSGGTRMIRAYWVIGLLFPLLFLTARMIPNTRTALTQMGFVGQTNQCLPDGVTGELLAGTSRDDTAYVTLRLADKTSVMCKIEGMNASGLAKGAHYSVPHGDRIS